VSSSQTTNPLTHISNAFNHSTQPQATLQRTQTVPGLSVDALHEMIQSMYTFTQETWNELESKQNEFQRMIHPYTCRPVHPYTHTPVPKLSDILPSPTRCLGSFQTCLPVPAWCLGSYLTPRTSLSPAGAWDHRPGMLLPVARTRLRM
jgi:hypothetical protein